jgi:acyl dehydratase
MGLVHTAMSSFLPNFKSHNHVHGEHFFELHKPYPIPHGKENIKLLTTARIVDVAERGNGVLVCVDMQTRIQETGDLLFTNEWAGFVMRVPGAGANRSLADRGPRTRLYASPDRKPDKTTMHRTSPEQAALYRAASGDLNPLHIDPQTAKAAGFPAPILTGTCTLGMGVRHVVDAFAGGEVGRFRSVKCRLSKPVFAALGENVRTEMWEEEAGRVRFRMVAEGGDKERVVISHGCVELRQKVGKL